MKKIERHKKRFSLNGSCAEYKVNNEILGN
jgi:hypothetical protein